MQSSILQSKTPIEKNIRAFWHLFKYIRVFNGKILDNMNFIDFFYTIVRRRQKNPFLDSLKPPFFCHSEQLILPENSIPHHKHKRRPLILYNDNFLYYFKMRVVKRERRKDKVFFDEPQCSWCRTHGGREMTTSKRIKRIKLVRIVSKKNKSADSFLTQA